MDCAHCSNKICYSEGLDCTKGLKEKLKKQYEMDKTTNEMMRNATEIESEGYMRLTRLEEIMLFSHKMNYTHLGIAFCVGLSEEAEKLTDILQLKGFKVSSVCCKVCGIDKKDLDLPQIKNERYEAICNPIGQAEILNQANTELNLIVGLCIGHDILFTKKSEAPVTTFIVKDRVVGHNPAIVLYNRYCRRKVEEGIS